MKPEEIAKWGGLLIGGSLAYKFLKGLGLIKSEQEQANEAAQAGGEAAANAAQFQSWTNPNFWKSMQPPAGYAIALLTQGSAEKWAHDMKSTAGTFNDDEAAMTGLLKKLRYKTQYSFAAYVFFNMYGKDLTAFLTDTFSAQELAPGFAYLNSLPTFVKK